MHTELKRSTSGDQLNVLTNCISSNGSDFCFQNCTRVKVHNNYRSNDYTDNCTEVCKPVVMMCDGVIDIYSGNMNISFKACKASYDDGDFTAGDELHCAGKWLPLHITGFVAAALALLASLVLLFKVYKITTIFKSKLRIYKYNSNVNAALFVLYLKLHHIPGNALSKKNINETLLLQTSRSLAVAASFIYSWETYTLGGPGNNEVDHVRLAE